jgi:hypothetical protein
MLLKDTVDAVVRKIRKYFEPTSTQAEMTNQPENPEEALLEFLNASSRACSGSVFFCASPHEVLAGHLADDVDRARFAQRANATTDRAARSAGSI